jgi:polysaccharide biosynthesis protein PslH
MKALLLSPEAPYPLAGGGALRTASLLGWLAKRYTVDAALFAVQGASDPAAAIPAGLVRSVVKLPLPAHSKSMPVRVFRNSLRLLRGAPPLLDRFSGCEALLDQQLGAERYDLAVVEHFWCAPYLPVLRRRCRAVYLDLHNIESEWHTRLGEAGPGLLRFGHRRFAAAYRRAESRWLPEYDGVLVPAAREAGMIPEARRVVVYANAIPARAVPRVEKDFSIAFSGNLEYAPNQQAVRFFAGAIWPVMRERHPGLLWRIVGKNPRAITALLPDDARIECTGPVEDAVATLARSQIAVVPVLAGSGTRVKILEAWAAQLPVVATTLGAEGLDAEPGKNLLLADTSADFAASISQLLASPELSERLALAGRGLYEERYTWDAAWRQLDREFPRR